MKIQWLHVGGLVAAAGVAAVLTIVYLVYAGRILGPEEYADFAAGLSIIYIFSVAVSSFTPTIARLTASLAHETAAVAALRTAVVTRLAVALVMMAIALAFLIVPVAKCFHFRSPAALIAAFAAAFLFTLVSVERGVLQGLTQFGAYNANILIESVIRTGGVIIALQWSRSAAAALATYGIALLAAELVVALRFAGAWRGMAPVAVDWRAVLRLTVPMTALMSAVAVFQNADMLAVKRWFVAADAGTYGAASAVARAIGVIFVPMYVFAGPLLVNTHASGSSLRRVTLQLCGAFLLLGAIVMLLFTFWPADVVRATYGGAYEEGARLIPRLAGVALLTYTALLLVQALITIGDFHFIAVYVAGAVAQLVTLTLWHKTFDEVLAALYLPQTATLIVIALLFVRRVR